MIVPSCCRVGCRRVWFSIVLVLFLLVPGFLFLFFFSRFRSCSCLSSLLFSFFLAFSVSPGLLGWFLLPTLPLGVPAGGWGRGAGAVFCLLPFLYGAIGFVPGSFDWGGSYGLGFHVRWFFFENG